MFENRLTVAVDFHGVLCRYQQGDHRDADQISDEPPTPGAIEWLLSLADTYMMCVTSARLLPDPALVNHVVAWLVKHGVPRDIIETRPVPVVARQSVVWVSRWKPRAWLYLDDRAFRFTGTFPSLKEVRDFRPWNR